LKLGRSKRRYDLTTQAQIRYSFDFLDRGAEATSSRADISEQLSET